MPTTDGDGDGDGSAGAVVGPLPFMDVDDGDARPPPREYDAIVAALPSNPKLRLRCYQGNWAMEEWIPGIITIQRGFTPRRGDVVLASPPKCGTAWLKALAFAVMARRAYPPPRRHGRDQQVDGGGGGAGGHHHHHPLLRLNPHECVPFMEMIYARGWDGKMDALPSPRLMATHMHHSALPASIAQHNPDCKIVYVCREPKDMLVSMWHFVRTIKLDVSFSDVFEPAVEGRCLSGPVWDHILGYWNASKASPERVLFLRYEDMLRDPAGNARELAGFLSQPFSPAEEEAGVVDDVVGLCSFDKLKSLEVNKGAAGIPDAMFSNETYFRKGMAGDWANHMTPEMARRLDAVFREKLSGSGLVFA